MIRQWWSLSDTNQPVQRYYICFKTCISWRNWNVIQMVKLHQRINQDSINPLAFPRDSWMSARTIWTCRARFLVQSNQKLCAINFPLVRSIIERNALRPKGHAPHTLTGGITTNQDLFKWGKIESPKCSLCEQEDTWLIDSLLAPVFVQWLHTIQMWHCNA